VHQEADMQVHVDSDGTEQHVEEQDEEQDDKALEEAKETISASVKNMLADRDLYHLKKRVAELADEDRQPEPLDIDPDRVHEADGDRKKMASIIYEFSDWNALVEELKHTMCVSGTTGLAKGSHDLIAAAVVVREYEAHQQLRREQKKAAQMKAHADETARNAEARQKQQQAEEEQQRQREESDCAKAKYYADKKKKSDAWDDENRVKQARKQARKKEQRARQKAEQERAERERLLSCQAAEAAREHARAEGRELLHMSWAATQSFVDAQLTAQLNRKKKARKDELLVRTRQKDREARAAKAREENETRMWLARQEAKKEISRQWSLEQTVKVDNLDQNDDQARQQQLAEAREQAARDKAVAMQQATAAMARHRLTSMQHMARQAEESDRRDRVRLYTAKSMKEAAVRREVEMAHRGQLAEAWQSSVASRHEGYASRWHNKDIVQMQYHKRRADTVAEVYRVPGSRPMLAPIDIRQARAAGPTGGNLALAATLVPSCRRLGTRHAMSPAFQRLSLTLGYTI